LGQRLTYKDADGNEYIISETEFMDLAGNEIKVLSQEALGETMTASEAKLVTGASLMGDVRRRMDNLSSGRSNNLSGFDGSGNSSSSNNRRGSDPTGHSSRIQRQMDDMRSGNMPTLNDPTGHSSVIPADQSRGGITAIESSRGEYYYLSSGIGGAAKNAARAREEGISSVTDRTIRGEYNSLPPEVRDVLERDGAKVVVTDGPVTEYWSDLRGEQPRGWPDGSTWCDVYGGYSPANKMAVVGVHNDPSIPDSRRIGGSSTTFYHELGHAYDDALGQPSHGEDFTDAYHRSREAEHLTRDYFLQNDDGYYTAGREETYAESFAWYNDPIKRYRLKEECPYLYDYWERHSKEMGWHQDRYGR